MKPVWCLLILVVGSLFFFGAAFWFYQSWQPRVELGLKSRTWPAAEAAYQSGYVSFEGSIANESERTNYVPVISYTFAADGIEYFSSVRSATGIGFASREEAEAFVEDYPKTDLKAYYDPADPNQSVLEPGVSLGYRLLVLLPVVLVLTGVLIFVSGVRELFLYNSTISGKYFR